MWKSEIQNVKIQGQSTVGRSFTNEELGNVVSGEWKKDRDLKDWVGLDISWEEMMKNWSEYHKYVRNKMKSHWMIQQSMKKMDRTQMRPNGSLGRKSISHLRLWIGDIFKPL